MRKGYLPPVSRVVGAVLRRWWEAAGLTPYALAQYAQVSEDTLYGYVDGSATPTLPVLERCCHVLGRELAELFAEAKVEARTLPPPQELGRWWPEE